MDPTERTKTRSILSLSLSGEVSTKSPRTRKRFHRRLRANLRDALARHDLPGRVVDRWDRIDVEDTDPAAAAVLARVFGIQAVRMAHSVPWKDVDDVVRAGHALFAEEVAGKRFAVRPRRVGGKTRVPIESSDIAVRLGQALVDAGGRVDLDHPEVNVHVETRPHDALIFGDPIAGHAGLPVGTEGRALALISGGFDSAVAAWRMLLRGLELDFVLFSFAGRPQERAVREILEVLDRQWMAGARPRLYVVDFRPLIAEMRKRVRGRYWQVVLKRMMMRAADHIALESGAQALITGEAVGQVSSQTLANLGAITARTETPVLRPLVGMNKDEIVAETKRIETYRISENVAEFCALDGGRPVTRTSPGELDHQEEKVGRDLVEMLARRHRIVACEAFGDDAGETVEIDRVPEGAAVIDLRDEDDFRRWAWPDAIRLDFDKALEFAGRLPNDRSYLFYCEFGLKSAWLAEAMRETGYEAYSYRGGAAGLRHLATRKTA